MTHLHLARLSGRPCVLDPSEVERAKRSIPRQVGGARRWRRIVLAGVIATPALFALPAAARFETTVTDAVGGAGGGAFRLSCPSGMAMVGLQARHGEWIDALAPICAIWVRGNRTLGSIEEQPGTGGTGGASGWARCAGRTGVVVGLWAWTMTDRPFVGRIALECGHYDQPERVANKNGRGADGLGQTFNGKRFELRCGRSEVAVGIYGRSGAFIDRVGLLCQRSRAVEPR